MFSKYKKLIFLVAIALFFVSLPVTLNVQAAESNLPGGTAISVKINTPEQNTIFNVTTMDETPINITGSASLGVGVTNADTTLIYILDASGSTEESAGANSLCIDQNPGDVDPHDPVPDENEIIDCEIGAAIALNDKAIALGTVDEVAVIIFAGDAVTADTSPSAEFTPLTAPDADANNNQVNDIEELLQSIQVAFLFGHDSGFSEFNQRDTPDIVKTDYGDALREAEKIIAQTSNENVIVMFVSDGANNAGVHVNQILPITSPGKHVVFHTFIIPNAYGQGNDCTADPNNLGSLQTIVDLQNSANDQGEGNCYSFENASDLPNLLPDIILPTLNMLEMSIDG
ncbi:MAG: hypothetical protein GY943_23705, partial [Chloroflexi bacterium]|nr:hypothetical protein [Chloroflexota bacterium]